MNCAKELQDFLQNEYPTFHWRCWTDPSEGTDGYVFVEAMINSRPLPHTPLHVSIASIERMGIESTAWLVSMELSPSRVDIDWDKLAEV